MSEIDLTRLLCRLGELEASGCREFRLGGGAWPLRGFVVRVDGGVRAYVNRCAHMAYPLNYAGDRFLSFDGRYLECSVHGALFDKDSGYCRWGPCAGLALTSLPVCVVEDFVLLDASADAQSLADQFA